MDLFSNAGISLSLFFFPRCDTIDILSEFWFSGTLQAFIWSLFSSVFWIIECVFNPSKKDTLICSPEGGVIIC